MLSMQHVLCGALLSEDDVSFKEQIGSLVLSDAIRAYSGPRQYSHFEKSADGTYVSWWKFPDDMKGLTKDSVQMSLKNDSHLVQDIQLCVLGETTDIQFFYEHNQHLPENMFKGIEMHLRQDIVYDEYDMYITNHDWSHLQEGYVFYEDYCSMYGKVMEETSKSSGYVGCHDSWVKMAESLCVDVVSCDVDTEYGV